MRTLKVHAARCFAPFCTHPRITREHNGLLHRAGWQVHLRCGADEDAGWELVHTGVVDARVSFAMLRARVRGRTHARTHTRDKRAQHLAHADSLSSHVQKFRCDYGSSHTRHAARGGVVEPTGRWCRAGHGRVRVRGGPRQCGGVQVFRIMRSEPAQPLCVEADDGAGGRKPLRTRTQARARTALCTALLRAHGCPHGSCACAATHRIADAQSAGECAGALLLRSAAHGAAARWIW